MKQFHWFLYVRYYTRLLAREIVSFVFPRDSLRFEGKQNYFPREQTLSVLLYSDEIKIKKQLYFVIKTIQNKRF